MKRLFPVKTHPFQLLLYLEWILLFTTFIGELPWEQIPYLKQMLGDLAAQSQPTSSVAWVNILCIVLFGLMGLRLPKGKTVNKWVYTALELGIIWLVNALGGWQVSFLIPYLIVVLRSCLIFSPRERLVVTGLIFVSFLCSLVISVSDISAIQQELTQPKPVSLGQIKIWLIVSSINTAFLFALVLVFVLMLVNALLSERQSRQKLSLANDQLRQYALRIEDQATLQERNRIAREIHDSLGHALTAQSIQLENALLFCHSEPEKTEAFLTQAKELGKMALKDIRQSVSSLRSDPLQGESLASALRKLVADFSQNTHITLENEIHLPHPVSSQISIAVYRIVQEALTNIVKHSEATQVSLKLHTTPEYLHLLIEDNGQGFHPEQNTTGFGLQGMRERTLALGGYFQLTSGIKSGCCVSVDIPLVKLVL